MDPPAGFLVAGHPRAVFAALPGQLFVIRQTICVIVGINEILAGVIGRVNIDQLHLARIGFAQQLQHLQIIALDHNVLGRVPILAVALCRAQRAEAWGQRKGARAGLAFPIQAIAFSAFFHLVAQQLSQYLEIDLSVGNDAREQGFERRDIFPNHIPRMCGRIVTGNGRDGVIVDCHFLPFVFLL